MIRIILAIVVGFLVSMNVTALFSMFVVDGLIPQVGIARADMSVSMEYLAAGYFLLSIFMVWLVSHYQCQSQGKKPISRLRTGLKTGLMTAVVLNIAGLLMMIGWTNAVPMPTMIVALADSVGTVLAAVAIAYVLPKKS